MSKDETVDGGPGFKPLEPGQKATTVRHDPALIWRAAARHVDAYEAIELALVRFRTEEVNAPYAASYIEARIALQRASVEVDESWLELKNAVTHGGEP